MSQPNSSSPPRIFRETKVSPAFDLIFVQGGPFQMGGTDYSNQQPIHPVIVPGFYLGQYPVTQALWQVVMGENPSRFKAADRPVEQVSWHDCQDFVARLNTLTDGGYRLPSEAEWEYAARGGSLSEGYRYSGSDKLSEVGWYDKNSGGKTQPVGLKLPNELGLYDLSGNVREWCEDDWHGTYAEAPDDGSAWTNQTERASRRVNRGGRWNYGGQDCRVSFRVHNSPGNRNRGLGLRLARQFGG